MKIQRYLMQVLMDDALADRKMAFISGPRQVGKTFLAKQCLGSELNYFNWDVTEFKLAWSRSPLKAIEQINPGPVVFDELHKYPHWKNTLKGLYDQVGEKVPIIVTGSARLDLYKKGGDSLLGRYLPYRLHPLTVGELPDFAPDPDHLEPGEVQYPLKDLISCSGFPEPLLGGSSRKARRWSRLRREQLVREDIRDFRNIRNIELIKLLVELLPERVGSPLSLNSLREDLQVAYATVREWIAVLQNLYICFQVPPYSRDIARSLRKEAKFYLFDWLPIKNQGPLLENIVAVHLQKVCHFWTDFAYDKFELCYIRTKEKQEVDFCIVREGKPWMLVECKSQSTSVSNALRKFAVKFPFAMAFQVSTADVDRIVPGSNIRILNIEKFLSMFI
ncbi:MAG: ATP-binding protein [Deltaproteobacteria bacterium]|nr:ATP-binding protein [Deltaproteobacteria bacterium]